MPGINKVTIVGRVGKDPEIRAISTGTEIATLSVATSEMWRDKNSGERKEKTEWHRIAVWGENAVRIVRDYVAKGDMIGIEGSIETRKWQAQDGSDRFSTEIVVKPFRGQVYLLGGNKSSDQRDGSQMRDDAPYAGAGSRGGGRSSRDDIDDNVPF
jgi:single-strand DNA-binding protein